MKSNSTFKNYSFFSLIFVLALSLNLNGQTSYNVSVTSFVFTPSQLTITAGDKVVWKNDGGSHNINGTQTTFPNNPTTFGNDIGNSWTYEYIFNTAGSYNYQCDPHASLGMVGTVIVNPKVVTSNRILADISTKIQLYPNPASQHMQIMIPPNYEAIRSVKVYTIAGAIVDEKALSGNVESISFDVSQYKNGIYLMEITAGNQRNVLKFIKQ